jgi:uncharacterized damage-inducible protein DinB
MSELAEVGLYEEHVQRGLSGVLAQLEGLSDEEVNWRPLPTANSLAAIATHVMGNLAQYLWVLGGPPYARDREAEFRVEAVQVEDLRRRGQTLEQTVAQVLRQLPPGALDRTFEHPRQGTKTGRELLLSLITHLAEHVGEAGLTRALLLARRAG